jgi:hypothetical protein
LEFSDAGSTRIGKVKGQRDIYRPTLTRARLVSRVNQSAPLQAITHGLQKHLNCHQVPNLLRLFLATDTTHPGQQGSSIQKWTPKRAACRCLPCNPARSRLLKVHRKYIIYDSLGTSCLVRPVTGHHLEPPAGGIRLNEVSMMERGSGPMVAVTNLYARRPVKVVTLEPYNVGPQFPKHGHSVCCVTTGTAQ